MLLVNLTIVTLPRHAKRHGVMQRAHRPAVNFLRADGAWQKVGFADVHLQIDQNIAGELRALAADPFGDSSGG